MPVNPILVASIEDSAKKIVDREWTRDKQKLARRDQHAKHHGCVWAYLDVLPTLPARLKVGVFASGPRHRAWVRFSNSASRMRKDTDIDGRGLAIKLLVDNPEQPGEPTRVQDFILLNHSTFFAENTQEMESIFRWLAKDRSVLSYFLRHPSRWRGAWAIFKLASRPRSVLDLTYYTQLPSALGHEAVKYRLVPMAGVEPTQPTKVEKASGDHLRHVLRRQLRPNQRDRTHALNGREPPATEPNGDVLFSLEVQLQQEGDEIEVANVTWKGRFEPVAVLRIPRQDFEHAERMAFAEDMAFNVWNSLPEHEPLGDLSEARRQVYNAVATHRRTRNHHRPEPAYTLAKWHELRALPPTPSADVELKDVLSALSPFYARWLEKLITWRLAAFVWPGLVLGLALFCLYWFPEQVGHTIMVDGPLRALGAVMKSEQLIPKAIPSDAYLKRLAREGKRYPEQDSKDPEWQFRYGQMGAEFSAGIPYWVYRVLPKVVPDKLADWSEFGLINADDEKYYKDYHGLPRGLALSDSIVTLGNMDYGIPLKRVALNCASCHRGEVRVDQQQYFINGMPNLNFDPASFKHKLSEAIASESFTSERVIEKINEALAEEHARQGRSGAPHRLSFYERFVYWNVVRLMKESALARQAKLAWMKRRPENGPGRLDAFGAFRYEVLELPDAPAETPPEELLVATVDLPSVWNQGPSYRPKHHYDGNTEDGRARNIGAIIGVGGHPASVRFRNIQRVAAWLDDKLKPPPYPLAAHPQDPAVQRGKKIFEQKCSGCHGSYDEQNRLRAPTPCMQEASFDRAHTDPNRSEAVDEAMAKKLNELGLKFGIWGGDAFKASGAYLCPPLDGIWARAPYLHNGSVPTLDHLLSGRREQSFWRGNPEYDHVHGGFTYDKGEPTRLCAEFRIAEHGNSAAGHDGPRQLVTDAGEREDLIQYLYQL